MNRKHFAVTLTLMAIVLCTLLTASSMLYIRVDSNKVLSQYRKQTIVRGDKTSDILRVYDVGVTETVPVALPGITNNNTAVLSPDTPWAEQRAALASSGAPSDAYYQNYLNIVNIDGNNYIYEVQGAANYSEMISASGKNTVSSAGCFYFAAAAAATYLRGTVYTVENAIEAQGYDITVDNKGIFRCDKWVDLNGSQPRLETILRAAGVNAKVTPVSAVSLEELQAGYSYIIYAHSSAGSSNQLRHGEGHWTYIPCATRSGEPIVLCNSKRPNHFPLKEFNNLKIVLRIEVIE